MNSIDQLYPLLDRTVEVMASPVYQQVSSSLFDLFCMSRKADKNPKDILEVQASLSELMQDFQERKTRSKKENRELDFAITKRLILVLTQIADSIVWRALDYDRVRIQLLSEHSRTGHLDDTVHDDLAAAEEIVRQPGAIVLLNDVSSILRHGDLTVVRGDSIEIVETKYGTASRKSRRAGRQRRRLESLVSFLNTGVRESEEGRKDFIIRANLPIHTYHHELEQTIKEARRTGYSQKTLGSCLEIEAFCPVSYPNVSDAIRPLGDSESLLGVTNWLWRDELEIQCAPYGVFPLDDESCFDLIRGDVLRLVSKVYLDRLQEKYDQYGLILSLPNSSDLEKELFLSHRERAKRQRNNLPIVEDSAFHNRMTSGFEFLTGLGLEFICEDTIIQRDQQSLSLMRDLEISPGSRFYFGYADESQVWT